MHSYSIVWDSEVVLGGVCCVDATTLLANDEVGELLSVLFLSDLFLNDLPHFLVVVHDGEDLLVEDTLFIALEAAHEVVVGAARVESSE